VKMKAAVVFLVFLSCCFAQQTFIRVFLMATGEVQTISYFDYDPATRKVLRIQSISDALYLMGILGADNPSLSSIAADDIAAYGILNLPIPPNVETFLFVLNHGTCQLSKIFLPNASPQGLTIDPIQKVLYYNYIPNGKAVAQISGINRMNYDGTNVTSIFQYPTVGNAHWLSLDKPRNLLYASLAANQFSSIDLMMTNVTVTVQTPGCLNGFCDINLNGGVVEQTTGRIYYPDATGIVSYDPATTAMTRVFTAPNNLQVKGFAIDTQNNLLFMQTFAIQLPTGQIADGVYVVSVNLTAAVADAATFMPIPGLLGVDSVRGNIVALSHCDAAACGICGFGYTNPFNAPKYASAALFSISITLLLSLLAIVF